MIEQGSVKLSGEFYHAVCVLHIWGDRGVMTAVEALVDTGFAGEIALPQRLVDQLGLEFEGSLDILVADGRTTKVRTYSSQIDWQGEYRRVEVISTETFPLIGMALLRGSRLCMDVEDAGEVEIAPFDRP